MLNVSGLTKYGTQKNLNHRYKELETNFLQDTDKLFDIFCYDIDSKQRKQCEIQYGLRLHLMIRSDLANESCAVK